MGAAFCSDVMGNICSLGAFQRAKGPQPLLGKTTEARAALKGSSLLSSVLTSTNESGYAVGTETASEVLLVRMCMHVCMGGLGHACEHSYLVYPLRVPVSPHRGGWQMTAHSNFLTRSEFHVFALAEATAKAC
jgi:hypothetical protein